MRSNPALQVRAAWLDHQGSIEVRGAKDAVLAHFASRAFAHAIQAQIVLRQIDLGQQPPLDEFHLHQVDLTLENGLLDALTHALAHLGHAAQTAAPGRRFGVDVVADNQKHDLPLKERQIAVGLPADCAREKSGLDQREQAERNRLG